jgi:hypothetical protein
MFMTLYYVSRPKFWGYCNKARLTNQIEKRKPQISCEGHGILDSGRSQGVKEVFLRPGSWGMKPQNRNQFCVVNGLLPWVLERNPDNITPPFLSAQYCILNIKDPKEYNRHEMMIV